MLHRNFSTTVIISGLGIFYLNLKTRANHHLQNRLLQMERNKKFEFEFDSIWIRTIVWFHREFYNWNSKHLNIVADSLTNVYVVANSKLLIFATQIFRHYPIRSLKNKTRNARSVNTISHTRRFLMGSWRCPWKGKSWNPACVCPVNLNITKIGPQRINRRVKNWNTNYCVWRHTQRFQVICACRLWRNACSVFDCSGKTSGRHGKYMSNTSRCPLLTERAGGRGFSDILKALLRLLGATF